MDYFKTILLILLVSTLQAQEYTPLVAEGATWINHYSEEYPDTDYRAYQIEGDTLVNAIMYKNIYMYNLGAEVTDPITYTSRTHFGIIREDIDNKKIYGNIDVDPYSYGEFDVVMCDGFSLDNEFLLYDFDVQVGSILANCHLDPYEQNSSIIKDTLEYLFGFVRKQFQ